MELELTVRVVVHVLIHKNPLIKIFTITDSYLNLITCPLGIIIMV